MDFNDDTQNYPDWAIGTSPAGNSPGAAPVDWTAILVNGVPRWIDALRGSSDLENGRPVIGTQPVRKPIVAGADQVPGVVWLAFAGLLVFVATRD